MKVVINRGIPGSGKSTGTKKLMDAEKPGMVKVVSSDLYPGLYDADGTFHPELLSKSHPACMREFIHACEMRIPFVIVDNTNTMPHEVAPYLLVAQSFGADVEIIRYDAGSVDVAFERNSHGVPLDVCIRMFNQMKDNPLPRFWPRERIVYTHGG